MQSLRAKRLEEGTLFELFQAEGGTCGDRRYSAIERRKGFHKFEDWSSSATGIYRFIS